MKQKDIEKRLTELQETNPQSEEIYTLLVELVTKMLKSQNWLLQPMDMDNVSHDVATSIYLKVYSGDYKVTYWRALAYKMLKLNFVPKQRELTMTQVFDTHNDPLRKEQIYKICTSGSNLSFQEINVMENKSYLANVRGVIKETLDELHTNYNSSEMLNLYISVCLSLLHEEDKLFHLKKDFLPYVHLLTEQVRHKIGNSEFFSTPSKIDILSTPDFENILMPDLEFLGLLDD